MTQGDIAYVGALLKLACPGGEIASRLICTGGDDIQYQIEGSNAPPLPWPPDPTCTDYTEICSCAVCGGRRVGERIDVLRAVMDEIHSDPNVNVDTYFLNYLERARDIIEHEALLGKYAIRRRISTFTDTYVRSP
jgi:hypothetical protein